MTQNWTGDCLGGSPAFDPLRRFGSVLRGKGWPEASELQQLLDDARAMTSRGTPLRLVPQAPKPRCWEDRYEARLYLGGELQMRGGNWHDLFNVLVWAAFPRAKAALNARHYEALLRQRASGDPNRGPVQDALTLFDEGGVVVACSDPRLASMLENFAWKDLFWHSRTDVQHRMDFRIFGHALYEKLLEPHAGITGRGLLFEVGTDFHALDADVQVAQLDALLAARISDPLRLTSTRELAPVPLLGVPGWCADNAREAYYDNIGYFRPGRRAGKTQSPL